MQLKAKQFLCVLVSVGCLGLAFGCGDDGGPDGGTDMEEDECCWAGDYEDDDCPHISPWVNVWSCRTSGLFSGGMMCIDYPKATWSEADAICACKNAMATAHGVIHRWSSLNCALDNFHTTWRCAATSDGINPVSTYYYYARDLPVDVCTGLLKGTVEEPADAGCWTDTGYNLVPSEEPDAGPHGSTEYPCADAICPDISPGVPAWSCRASDMPDAKPMCRDYPKATWTEAAAIADCQTFVDRLGGEITSWATVNCAVDNYRTTWRCAATGDDVGKPGPTYYFYSETFPVGLCTTLFMGSAEERVNGCWMDYE